MGVVIKRADELKAGDMLAGNGYAGRIVVSVGAKSGNTIEVKTQGADSNVTSAFMGAASQVLVAQLDLTPAQQHADQLLAFVEAAADSPARTALIDKIKPPAPITLAEVITALAATQDPKAPVDATKHAITQLLARAKREGLVK